ncbi:major facilitator superfamily domain-containing protein 10 isoform X2 [Physeter macrocephalus]|uniref:Major facilitator superfamily domain-containing protein 10 isoform X2 n=1 Tax=Physeter macrocephalus TaxID=9755 RepID=A0A455B0X2_PHYMC|nr:major facilitator superfamily domain-containing protein 10 isoform X2 [Physeter catodon]|eukprot:XP_028342407.1 major facilitator superfamily domain-containing protein 10 isoform X2 [Physeter catodon]
MGWGAGGSCTPRPPIHQQPASETRVVVVVFLGLLLDLLAFTLLLPLLPALLESHGRAQDPLYGSWQRGVDWFAAAIGMPAEKRYNSVLFGGLIGSVFSFLQFLSAPLTGAVSDCLGRRPVMLLSLAGLATSYAVWAASKSFAAFLVSRMIGGISKGNVSLSTAVVADLGLSPARSRGMSSGWPSLWPSRWAPCLAPPCPWRRRPGWPCSLRSPICCSSPVSCRRRCPRRSGHRRSRWGLELRLTCSAPWPCSVSQRWHVARTRPPESGWAACACWAWSTSSISSCFRAWSSRSASSCTSASSSAGHPAAGPRLPPRRLGAHAARAGPGAAALLLRLSRAEGRGHGHAAEPGSPGQGSGAHGGRLSVLAGRGSGLLHCVRGALPAPLLPSAEAEACGRDAQDRVAEPPVPQSGAADAGTGRPGPGRLPTACPTPPPSPPASPGLSPGRPRTHTCACDTPVWTCLLGSDSKTFQAFCSLVCLFVILSDTQGLSINQSSTRPLNDQIKQLFYTKCLSPVHNSASTHPLPRETPPQAPGEAA